MIKLANLCTCTCKYKKNVLLKVAYFAIEMYILWTEIIMLFQFSSFRFSSQIISFAFVSHNIRLYIINLQVNKTIQNC